MEVIRGCFNDAVNLSKQVTNLIQFISTGKKELNWIRMVVNPVGNLRLTALGISFLFMVEACLEVINMVATERGAVAGNVEGGKEIVIGEILNVHSVNSVKGCSEG